MAIEIQPSGMACGATVQGSTLVPRCATATFSLFGPLGSTIRFLAFPTKI